MPTETTPAVAGQPTAPSARIIGCETEFAIASTDPGVDAYAQSIRLATEAVLGYGRHYRPAGGPVRWDYGSEDPLNDMRGHRLDRAAAHPSQLTDDPERAAAAISIRPEAQTDMRSQPANIVTTNGARFYVDHAHPEYSAPEACGPRAATLYDRAGEEIARQAMAYTPNIVLYKNNVDGKGAAWGTHENYLVTRTPAFGDIARAMTPLLITRPVLCGAGRVGGGQVAREALFQISQRADFVENEVGLETTFNRPIINTRDEPHADAKHYRRFHVINGDANQFDYSTYLRVGVTSTILTLIEAGLADELPSMSEDPVLAVRRLSRDIDLRAEVATSHGQMTQLQLLGHYLQLAARHLPALTGIDTATADLLDTWSDTLDDLAGRTDRAAARVEWFAKYRLFGQMAQRLGGDWLHPKLLAMDLQWADLRPERNLVAVLDRGGRVDHLFSADEIRTAATTAPRGTRAWMRGELVAQFPATIAAGWTAVELRTEAAPPRILRVHLGAPDNFDETIIEQVKEQL